MINRRPMCFVCLLLLRCLGAVWLSMPQLRCFFRNKGICMFSGTTGGKWVTCVWCCTWLTPSRFWRLQRRRSLMRTNGKKKEVESKCSKKCQWLNVSRQAAPSRPQTGQMPLTSSNVGGKTRRQRKGRQRWNATSGGQRRQLSAWEWSPGDSLPLCLDASMVAGVKNKPTHIILMSKSTTVLKENLLRDFVQTLRLTERQIVGPASRENVDVR